MGRTSCSFAAGLDPRQAAFAQSSGSAPWDRGGTGRGDPRPARRGAGPVATAFGRACGFAEKARTESLGPALSRNVRTVSRRCCSSRIREMSRSGCPSVGRPSTGRDSCFQNEARSLAGVARRKALAALEDAPKGVRRAVREQGEVRVSRFDVVCGAGVEVRLERDPRGGVRAAIVLRKDGEASGMDPEVGMAEDVSGDRCQRRSKLRLAIDSREDGQSLLPNGGLGQRRVVDLRSAGAASVVGEPLALSLLHAVTCATVPTAPTVVMVASAAARLRRLAGLPRGGGVFRASGTGALQKGQTLSLIRICRSHCRQLRR